MIGGMRQHFSKKIRWEEPEGGLFIWCTLPEDCDMLHSASVPFRSTRSLSFRETLFWWMRHSPARPSA